MKNSLDKNDKKPQQRRRATTTATKPTLTEVDKARRKSVGQWLADKRLDIDMPQREMAAIFSFKNPTMISGIENGYTRLPDEHWAKYVDTLGIGRRDFAMRLIQSYHPDIFDCLLSKE